MTTRAKEPQKHHCIYGADHLFPIAGKTTRMRDVCTGCLDDMIGAMLRTRESDKGQTHKSVVHRHQVNF